MDQQGTDAVSIFESQPQPIQLTQGKAVMVQHLGATQSVGQGQIPAQLHQINPEQQSLDLQHFALNTGQLSGNSQVEIDMNSAGISVLPTQEQVSMSLDLICSFNPNKSTSCRESCILINNGYCFICMWLSMHVLYVQKS